MLETIDLLSRVPYIGPSSEHSMTFTNGEIMNPVQLTREFVSYNSVSYLSNVDCANAMARRMREAGLKVERIAYRDPNGVPKLNLVGKKGSGTGGLALMGHNDVVPATGWAWDPFKVVKKVDRIYGRGVGDMKGSVACMIAAASRFSARDLKRPIYVVVTGDEEINCLGADVVAKKSKVLKEVHYGIIGEPTLLDVVHAHKGSIKISVTSKGKATHSSIGKGVNSNHKLIPFLNDMLVIDHELQTKKQYLNNAFTPPHSTMNTVIHGGEQASNITTPESGATINMRPMPGQNLKPLLNRVKKLAKKHGVQVKIFNDLFPLNTPTNSRIVQEALRVTGKRKPKTVSYGTDGMIFGKTMELVVLGPGSIQQAHTIDEWIAIDQLHKGVDVFAEMARRFCIENPE
jgi:acetylornithine deacetylase